MTGEQERAIEALTLRDHGFAQVAEGRALVRTPDDLYAVDPDGDVFRFGVEPERQGLRSLLAEVYGKGAQA